MDLFTKEEFAKVEEILHDSHRAASDGVLGEYVKKLGIYYQAQDSVSPVDITSLLFCVFRLQFILSSKNGRLIIIVFVCFSKEVRRVIVRKITASHNISGRFVLFTVFYWFLLHRYSNTMCSNHLFITTIGHSITAVFQVGFNYPVITKVVN